METDQSEVKIRNASASDLEFVTGLLQRHSEFGAPPWRNPESMHETDANILTERIQYPTDNAAIFIAETLNGTPLGFIHIHKGADHYNHDPHGHISDLVVAREAEGKGIARRLIAKAEEWCSARGFGWLSLSVFYQNSRARALYDRLGFGEDILKCVKLLKNDSR